MSFDLAFWRESRKQDMPANEIYNRLIQDEEVDGIQLLEVEAIRKVFFSAFVEMRDEGPQLVWDGDGGGFQISWQISMQPGKTQAIFAACALSCTKDLLNRVMDVGLKLGCAVYDPQVDQRFDQPELPG